MFPFNKFAGVDPILGPEMKSTGEVMGVGDSFAEAYSKAQLAGQRRNSRLRTRHSSAGRDVDKAGIVDVARQLLDIGFVLVATRGTAEVIAKAGLEVQVINKVLEGRPHIVDMIKNDQVQLIVNTTEGRQAIADSSTIRSSGTGAPCLLHDDSGWWSSRLYGVTLCI